MGYLFPTSREFLLLFQETDHGNAQLQLQMKLADVVEVLGGSDRIKKERSQDVEIGDAIALIGSHGWVEIAINSGNAQLQLHIQLGDAVEVCF